MSTFRKGTLEKVIMEMLTRALPEGINPDSRTYEVRAFELWRESEGGWSVNNSWRLCRDGNLSTMLDCARGRWEAFKVNYLPKARVGDIRDESYEPSEIVLEVDCTSFLTIRINAETNNQNTK